MLEIWRYTFETTFPDESSIITEFTALDDDMAWSMYDQIGAHFTEKTEVEIALKIQWL